MNPLELQSLFSELSGRLNVPRPEQFNPGRLGESPPAPTCLLPSEVPLEAVKGLEDPFPFKNSGSPFLKSPLKPFSSLPSSLFSSLPLRSSPGAVGRVEPSHFVLKDHMKTRLLTLPSPLNPPSLKPERPLETLGWNLLGKLLLPTVTSNTTQNTTTKQTAVG